MYKMYTFLTWNLNVSSRNKEKSFLKIGNNNKFRENVTVNPGTSGGGLNTIIGNNCLFMVGSHVAHDCIIKSNVILANNATLAGHVEIDNNAILGGYKKQQLGKKTDGIYPLIGQKLWLKRPHYFMAMKYL